MTYHTVATISRRWSLTLVACCCLLSGLLLGSCAFDSEDEDAEKAHFALLADFTNQVVLGDVDRPLAMRFLPDGRLLLARKTGQILIGNPNGSVPMQTAEYLQLPNLLGNLERGLLDIELDPNFETNRWVYLYYTPADPRFGRITRLKHVENSGGLSSRGELATEEVLWQDTSGYVDCCHYGGSLGFGPDGKLYATLGDKFDSNSAQDLTKASGKILRLNPDGSIPSDNPFRDGPGGNEDAIWAYGLRNPFRAKWDFERGAMYIAEVGGNDLELSYEDVHVLPAGTAGRGMNFGFPYCEGPGPYSSQCNAQGHSKPAFSYQHSGKNAAVIAGPVYRGDQFPSVMQGALFYGDFSRRWIRYATFDADGKYKADFEFEAKSGPVVAMEQSPDGALYYLTMSGGTTNASTGDLRRIIYNNGNAPPTVESASATPSAGAAPLAVQFQATVEDADGDPLTFEWDFGDGTTASGAVPASGTVTTTHTYNSKGQFDARLRVADAQRTTLSDPLRVRVGVAPVPSIDTPSASDLFRADQTISFTGSVTDPDETKPQDVIYAWTVQFKHDDHFHPVLGPVSLGPQGGAFDVNDAAHDFIGDTGFRIDLQVTDSDGITGATSVEIYPEKVNLSLASNPPGAELMFDYAPVIAPKTYATAIGWSHHVSAPATRCVGGTEYTFDRWSDGQAISHDITVPNSNSTLTAIYDATGSCSTLPVTSGLVLHLQAGSGAVADGSGVVTDWFDQSSKGNDLTTTTGNPLLEPTAANGRSAVTFDGIDDSIGTSVLTGMPTGAGNRTVVIRVRYHSDGWGGFVWGRDVCNRAFGLVVSLANNGQGKISTIGWCAANDQVTAVVGTGAGWLTHSAVVNSNSLRQYVDGQLVGSFDHTYNTASDELRIGRNIGIDTPVAMDVAEILVFDRALSDSERAQIEDYLDSNYGGTGNAAPIAVGDSATLSVKGESATIQVLDNDTDSDGTLVPSSVVITQAPAHGSVSVSGVTGAVTYAHDGSSTTSDSFLYTVKDNQGATSNAAQVDITINGGGGAAGAPVSSGLVFWLRGDQGVNTSGGNVVSWNDLSGSGNHLTVTSGNPGVTTGGLNGHNYVHFDGVDDGLGRAGTSQLPTGAGQRSVFMVVRYDSSGWGGFAWGNPACNRAFGTGVAAKSGNLLVQGWCGANDFTSATKGTGGGFLAQSAVYDGTTVVHYLNNMQIDSATHAYNTGTNAIRLGVELDDRTKIDMDVAELLVYNRALNSTERAQVQTYLNNLYFASQPTNQPPTANPDSGQVSAPAGSVTVNVLANDSDSDGTLVPATVKVVQQPGNGTTQINTTTGAITYTHNGSATTSDSFKYTVADDDGAVSTAATVTVTIASGGAGVPVSSGLVFWLRGDQGVAANGQAVTQWADQSGSGNHLSVVSGSPTFNATGLNGHGYVGFDGVDDGLGRTGTSLLPTAATARTVFMVARYESAGWGGFAWGNAACNRAFGTGVAGSSGNLLVQGWCGANDFIADQKGEGAGWLTQAAVYSNGNLTHYLNGTQIDSGTHTFDTGSAGIRLGIELNDRTKLDMDVAELLVYNRALSASERQQVQSYLDTLYFGGSSGGGSPSNQAPTANADSGSVSAPGGSVVINVLSNDSDADGSLVSSSVAIVQAPAHGSVSVGTNGAVTYTHDGSATTTDSFTYKVNDDDGAASNAATVSVTIASGGGASTLPVTSGLVMWLQGDKGVTTGGGGVSKWADQSGVGNDLVVTSGNPTFSATGVSGHGYVGFDGVDDGLGRTGTVQLPTGAGKRSIFMVVRYDSDGWGGFAWGNTSCNQAFGLGVAGSTGNLMVQGWCGANDIIADVKGQGAGWHAQSTVYNGSTVVHYLDGTQIDSATHAFNTGTGRIRLGAELSDRIKLDMDVAELIVYNRDLSASERAAIDSYLDARY